MYERLTISVNACQIFHQFDCVGSFGIQSRVLVVKIINVGHQEKVVCLDHLCSDSREDVTASELKVLFVRQHCVLK
jgi:hypothetical protein